MYKNIFQKAGLTPTQALILDYLYEKKEGKAGEIAKKIKKSRAIVYKDLEELAVSKLIEKTDKPGQVSVFRVGHPSYMEKFFDQKEDKIKKDRQLFKSYLPDIVSAYNLMSDKPAVKFYEGEDGLKKVLDDTLKSKTEIYMFLDKDSLQSEEKFKKINEEYKLKREKMGIKKKIIRVGKPPLSQSKENESYAKITEIKYFDNEAAPFKSSIQIYDNKISYQIINEGRIVSVIIEDKHIYEMNKIWFEFLWKNCV